jgi:nitrite reductase/ring-hydroxylating ferredoxin subunit/uncharacterized membrane protein
MDVKGAIIQTIEQQVWLESFGKSLQQVVRDAFSAGGRAGIVLADFLNGVWLGHPLHPVITDVPVGAWTVGAALDIMEASTGNEALGTGADVALGIGLGAAGGAVVSGLADYQHLGGDTRKMGTAHALLNVLGVSCYLTSLVLRKQGNRGAGRAFSFLGYGIVAASAYLGGELVYSQKIGVDHAPQIEEPEKFTAVMADADLAEGQMRCVEVEGTPVMLTRRGKRVYALANTCSHLGGPLAEGELKDEGKSGDPSVVCPWHGSRFSLEDGSLMNGPSTYNQPCYETRIRSWQIELRAVKESYV